MSPSPPSFLPDDLIAEVLSFLDVKSIMRFRCVCKFWNTLTLNATFVKSHRKKSAKQNPHFLLIADHLTGSDYGFVSELGVIPYSVSSLLDNPCFSLSVESYYLLKDKGCSDIVGSCNGLICLVVESDCLEYYDYWFRLWNPATRTISPKLGFLGNRPGSYKFAFGYDNSTGTYKTVAWCYNRRKLRSYVRILSFSDNVWRDIGSFPVDPLWSLSTHETGVSFKSTINWLAIHNTIGYSHRHIKNITIEQFLIVSLDLRTETYNQYLLPREFDEVPPTAPIISVLGDFLCFSYCYKETHFIIWQMKKFGVQDSWTQFLKISYHNLQIDYDYSNEYIKYHFELVPLFLSKDSDTLVLHCNLNSHQIVYNWRNNRVVRTNISARKTITDDQKFDSVSCSTSGYFESLVSVF